MLVGTRQQRHRAAGVMVDGLIVFVMICSFLLASCGAPPPDHPLTTDTNTPVNSVSPTTSSGSRVVPIKVIGTQTNLSTYPGGYMTMTVSTNPFAVCNFVVYYGLSTPSKAYGIIPRTADAHGIVNWRWQVEPNAHTGIWPLMVSAVLPSGAKTSVQVNATVDLAPINVINSQSNLTAAPKGNMVLTIATAPSITCTLLLNFENGKLPKTLTTGSDSNGIASWTWRVDDLAPAGIRPLTITAILADGERSSAQVNMTIL